MDPKTTTPARTRAPRFISDVRTGGLGLQIADLRSRALAEPRTFGPLIDELIYPKDGSMGLRWCDIRRPRDVYAALADVPVQATMPIMGEQRAIMASAFPLLAGGLSVAGVNDAYEAVPTIGQDLVTDFEDNKKVTHIMGVLAEDEQIDRVDEAKDFPEIGAGQERFDILHKRNGRRLSITAEMIEENDIAGITERLNALGRIAAKLIETQTLRRVCDIDGSGTSPAEPYVLHHQGAGAALYTTSTDSPGTRAPSGTRITNNALIDNTDLEAARIRLSAMLDDLGQRLALPMSECQLVVPNALAPTAFRILKSEYEPGIFNELNPWGPRGAWQPKMVTSARLDDLDTTVWYLGNFQAQFKRKWKLRAEYVTLGQDTQAYLQSRIAFQMRVAWDVEIGAVDYVYVVQCLAGTTAPS